MAKVSAIMTWDMLVLALATLGSAKDIGSFLFIVVPHKVAKARTVVTVMWLWHVAVADGFANKLCQCKQSVIYNLHWWHLLAITPAPATSIFTCLGHLGWRDTDRIVSIYVMLPKVAKASTVGTVTWQYHVTPLTVLPTNFANVNNLLWIICIGDICWR